MLYTNSASKLSWFLGSGEDFLSVFSIYGHGGHRSMVQIHLNKLSIPLRQKAPCEHVHTPWARADNPWGTKFWFNLKVNIWRRPTPNACRPYRPDIAILKAGFLKNPSKNHFQNFPYTNVWECKFDLAIKRSTIILESSFEQTWQALTPQCYIPRFSVKAFLVLEKKIFKCFFYHIWPLRPSCSVVWNH